MQDLGVSLFQLILYITIWVTFSLWATLRVTLAISGKERFAWLLAIWIVPILGAIAALIAVRQKV